MIELPREYQAAMADLTSHEITGFARMGNTPFSCPLVTHVEGNLWQGGTPADVGKVPGFFKHVLNLYPWGRYEVPEGTEVRAEALYDGNTIPDLGLLDDLADWVNERRLKAPTLVHCQAGLNRSALVAGYALIKAGSDPVDVVGLLRRQRSPAVLCNGAFEDWLLGLGR